MNRPFFEEVQSSKQVRWLWFFILPFSFATILPFLYGIYWQIIKGEPWGDEPMTDEGLLGLFLLVLSGLLFVIWMISSIKLETKIDGQGIHYRFFPNQSKWRIIAKEDIEMVEAKKISSLLSSGGWGYHRNYFKKLRSMIISGTQVLDVKLKNGQLVRLGTQNSEQADRAARKLMSPQ